MKANEAPEKLYLHPTAKGKVGASWLTFPLTNEDVEYIRTDVFIEKAAKWIEHNFGKYDSDSSFEKEMFIEKFIKAQKGEKV